MRAESGVRWHRIWRQVGSVALLLFKAPLLLLPAPGGKERGGREQSKWAEVDWTDGQGRTEADGRRKEVSPPGVRWPGCLVRVFGRSNGSLSDTSEDREGGDR